MKYVRTMKNNVPNYATKCLQELCVISHAATHTMFVAGVCTNPLLFHCRKKYRVLIYNGDVDACVPYLGNEVSGCGGGGGGDDTWL